MMMNLTRLARRSRRGLLATSLIAVAGCGEAPSPDDEVASTTDAIIGGSGVSLSTRRTVGLVDVASPIGLCSGAIISRDWVLTAAHCLDYVSFTGTTVGFPRSNGTIESRGPVAMERVGSSDLAIVQLGAPAANSEWPDITRSMYAGNPAGLIGQNISCYGRGVTAYAKPSGVTAAGSWRTITRPVSSFSGGDLWTLSTSTGSEVGGPGDSGGPCFVSNQIAGVGSWIDRECTDPTNWQTCDATITKILATAWRSTTEFKSFIENARLRNGGTATFVPVTLATGWTAHPFSTNDPGATVVNNTVHLRGAIATKGTSPVALTLPVGFRPSTDVFVPTNMCGGAKGRLRITPQGVVIAQAEGSFADAQCFTSLDGVSFALNSNFSTALELEHGWVASPFETRPPRASVTNGIARLQGAIASGTATEPFTLPPQFRPATTTYVSVDLFKGAKGRLIVRSDGTVTIQSFSGFSAAQSFTSLEGVSYRVSGGFHAAALEPGWTSTSFGPPAPSYINILGIVRFSGAMKATGTGSLAFTLPANFAPATTVYVPVDLCASQKGRLMIQPSGTVSVHAPPGAWSAAQCFVSLEGVWFGL